MNYPELITNDLARFTKENTKEPQYLIVFVLEYTDFLKGMGLLATNQIKKVNGAAVVLTHNEHFKGNPKFVTE